MYMGLLGKVKGFFRRKEEEEEVYRPEWEETSLKRDDIDIHDSQQREDYVTACME